MFNVLEFLAAFVPMLIVLTTAVVVMIFDVFKPKTRVSGVISLMGLLLAFIFTVAKSYSDSMLLWGHLFWADSLGNVLQAAILLTVIFSIYYAYSKLANLDSAQGDVLSLYLFSTVGMMLLVSGNSLMALYLSLELTSLPLYALVASQRDHRSAVEASVKFFILGALASVFILFGISMLYGLSGQLDLDVLVNVLQHQPQQDHLMLVLGLIFLIVGISFKIALVPFHSWLPDVYVGANPVMTLFLSAAPKIAGIGLFLRLSLSGLFDVVQVTHQIIVVLALFSIILGNLVALLQTDLRRLLAYSTIAHMGYASLGIVAGGSVGYFSTLFYVLVYAVMAVLAFAVVILPREQVLLSVADLKNLSRRSPWMAAMLMLLFFSMAGVPPALGFLAKFFVIRALLSAGMYVVAIVALVFAVIAAGYYLNLIRMMYFEADSHELAVIEVQPVKKIIFMGQAFVLLLLGIFPNVLINICLQSFA